MDHRNSGSLSSEEHGKDARKNWVAPVAVETAMADAQLDIFLGDDGFGAFTHALS